jgi:hypothetical protein
MSDVTLVTGLNLTACEIILPMKVEGTDSVFSFLYLSIRSKPSGENINREKQMKWLPLFIAFLGST